MEDYVKYKTGSQIGVPEGSRLDCTPVVSYDNDMTLEKRF